MKKVLLFLIVITFGWGVKAQCPLTEAVDFTATDVHGTEIHLFDILDSGQYVLIDFFFTTCGPCQQVTPKIKESYIAMGCNMYDVFYMEIATGDSEAACLNWVNNYGIEYPTISGVAGGTSICGQYGIQYYPNIILIAPDRSIVIQDLWPVSNAQTVINALEQYGLQQHDCTEVDVNEFADEWSLFPNPANNNVTLKGENLGTVSLYNALGQKIDAFEADGNELTFPTNRYPNGVYLVKVAETTHRLIINHQ